MCVGSSVLFGLMAFATKRAAGVWTGPQVALARFVGSVLCVAAIVAVQGKLPPLGNWRPVVLRGVFGGFAVLLYFLCIEHIGVGLATLLNFTSPVFTALLSRLFLGERLRMQTLAGLVVALTGVTLVLLGGRGIAHPAALGWLAVGLGSAACSGVAVTAVRAARRTDTALTVFASFSGFGVLCTLGPALASPFAVPGAAMWGYLVVIVLFSVVAQLLMTSALRWVDAPTSGVIAQITVVITLLLGVLLLDEALTALSAAGSALTIIGVVLAVYTRAGSGAGATPVATT